MPLSTAARRALLAMRRRPFLDFSDYLELRRLRDRGARDEALDALIARMEAALPVPFADAIPDLATLEGGAAVRGLSDEALRAAFAMREEFARHGEARTALMGIDLPERPALPDWLDLVETERKHAIAARAGLRALDAKLWALFTGERRMPTIPGLEPSGRRIQDAGSSRILHQ